MDKSIHNDIEKVLFTSEELMKRAEEIGKQIKTKKQSALLNFRRSRIIMKFRFRECEIHSIK